MVKIRKAKKSDFEEYYLLKIEESKEYSKIIGKKLKMPSKSELKKEFYDFLNSRLKIIYLLENNKEIIANLNISYFKNIWSSGGYIEDIFVKKESRKKGFATKLIKEFIKEIKDKKLDHLSLSVNIKNKNAINLYKKLGFEIAKYDMRKKLK